MVHNFYLIFYIINIAMMKLLTITNHNDGITPKVLIVEQQNQVLLDTHMSNIFV